MGFIVPTKTADAIFDPVDGSGNPRGADMDEVRLWGTEIEDALNTWFDIPSANLLELAGGLTVHAVSGDVDIVTGDLSFAGTIVIDSARKIVGSGFRSEFRATIADDAAYSFTLPGAAAALVFFLPTTAPTALRPAGSFFAKVSGTAAASEHKINDVTNVAFTTGVLAGTTGTDGKFTISAHTDGKVYVENRTGASLTYAFMVVYNA